MNLVTHTSEKVSPVNYETFTNRTGELLAKLVLMVTIPIFAAIAVACIHSHIATGFLVDAQACKISSPGALPHCLLGINAK
jgi:hypothetical protein